MGKARSKDLYASTVAQVRGRQKKTAPSVITVQPRSADELADILIDRDKYPSPVRPLGSGSSTTRVNRVTAGTRVDMSRLNRIMCLDGDTVTVQAGVSIGDLNQHLEGEGLELVAGSAETQRTVGGAISSPTLGSDMPGEHAQFASGVVSLTLINGKGRKVEVTGRMRELLSLVRMSYGLLGIVYSATLRVRPAQARSARRSKLDFAEFARLIPVLNDGESAIHATCLPFRDRIHLDRYYSDGELRDTGSLPTKLRDWASTTVLGDMARTVTHIAEQSGSFTRFVPPGDGVNSVWLFPADRFGVALTTYQKFCTRHYRTKKFRCDLPAEIWRISADRASLLSPSYEGPMFALNLRSTSREGWDDFALSFAEVAVHFRGVPLFNQTAGFRAGYARRVYGERLHRFRAMRQQLDPDDRLLNQYLGEHLG